MFSKTLSKYSEIIKRICDELLLYNIFEVQLIVICYRYANISPKGKTVYINVKVNVIYDWRNKDKNGSLYCSNFNTQTETRYDKYIVRMESKEIFQSKIMP